MEIEDCRDTGLVTRLKQLDASAAPAAPGFDYDGMLARQANRVSVHLGPSPWLL